MEYPWIKNEKYGLWILESSPIDHWDGWVNADQFARNLVTGDGGPTDITLASLLETYLMYAYVVAKSECYWEGDIRNPDENYVALIGGAMPRNTKELILGWKQDNNGSTYIVSPIMLGDVDRFVDFSQAPRVELGIALGQPPY